MCPPPRPSNQKYLLLFVSVFTISTIAMSPSRFTSLDPVPSCLLRVRTTAGLTDRLHPCLTFPVWSYVALHCNKPSCPPLTLLAILNSAKSYSLVRKIHILVVVFVRMKVQDEGHQYVCTCAVLTCRFLVCHWVTSFLPVHGINSDGVFSARGQSMELHLCHCVQHLDLWGKRQMHTSELLKEQG